MALSFFSESAAPRDFRVSSTESDSHYTKCLLCFTIKKNFHCADCIKTGNFVNSSMPYSDRFADKQLKLHRLKANRKYFQDRCEALLHTKSRRDRLESDAKQCKERIKLIKLAIDQRKRSIEEKRVELSALSKFNNELRLKLPKYQKRVSSLCKHAQQQRAQLQQRSGLCDNAGEALAALRRARMRQLVHYIFPVSVTYDASESTDELEFLGEESRNEERRARVHVLTPWLPANCDFSHLQHCSSKTRRSESNEGEVEPPSPLRVTQAALSFTSQLTALLTWFMDSRLPLSLGLSEAGLEKATPAALQARSRRVRACVWMACVRAGILPSSATLLALQTLAQAVNTEDCTLARVEGWVMWDVCDEDAGAELTVDIDSDEDEPEHLHWVDIEQSEELSHSPVTPSVAPSLVTSAAASIASIWRGWTK